MKEETGSLMGCLHDPANFQQMYSKYTCWTFAGSCKHPISLKTLTVWRPGVTVQRWCHSSKQFHVARSTAGIVPYSAVGLQ